MKVILIYMGNNNSNIKEEFEKSELKYKEVMLLYEYLYDSYEKEFVNSDFCEKIIDMYHNNKKKQNDLIYKDLGFLIKPINEKNENNENNEGNLSNEDKNTLCERLKNDYNITLKRLKSIDDICFKIRNRIIAIISGPLCVSNPEVFDQKKCTDTGSIWKLENPLPDKNISLNKNFYDHLELIQNTYYKGLEFIIGYLSILYNTDPTIEIINSIIGMIYTELLVLNTNTTKTYNSLLTMPTYTQQDILVMKQNEQAVMEALRKSSVTASVINNKEK